MPRGYVPYLPLQTNVVSQWAYFLHKKATIERRILISKGVNRGQFNVGTGLKIKGV